MKALIAFSCGVVFAIGLGISGMLQPTRVIGFLDFAGAWDPTLLYVMCSAIPVYFVAWTLRRGRATAFGTPVPARAIHTLDRRLVIGALLFGIGWALAGVCPGPALVNLAAPSLFTVAVLAAVIAGIAASQLLAARAK